MNRVPFLRRSYLLIRPAMQIQINAIMCKCHNVMLRLEIQKAEVHLY
jgi:hypothetical protein